MMKRLLALCSTLCLGLLIVLTSCNNGDNLPKIEGSLHVNIFKTALTITASYVDSDNYDLYNDRVKAYIAVSSTGEEAKEISRKDDTITKPATEEKNLTGSKLDFSNLTADTTYSIKLVISSKGKQKTLTTKEVTTLSTGSSEEDPILIDSLDMLLGMNKTKDAYYKLTTDIDCGGTLTSIFNSSSNFSGTFDGNGHKIYNYKMDSNQYTGLFGFMSGATVKNLIIEDVRYDATRSNTFLGALAGYAKRCVITNVKVNNFTISHSGQTTSYAYIGGLVGQAINSTITDCSVENVSITTPSARLKMYIGGFIGENKNTAITNCYVTGTINSTISYTSNKDGCLYVGGFSGVNDSALGVSKCYAKVDITVSEPETVTYTGKETFRACVGGFNGGNINDASRFENCASLGDLDISIVHAYFAYVGGFAGYTDNQNISHFDKCVYIPKEKGLTAKFAVTPTEEDKKVEQTAFISLAVGKIGTKNENSLHVIVYKEQIEITNRHEKLTETPYEVSNDLSSFDEVIRNLIVEA
ncbi:MAG: hypothetical protein K2N64_06005 [Anaeroplasmataceae bacterium]|nr:hypothetical protein [Anaeroplasmataceae bacterium]